MRNYTETEKYVDIESEINTRASFSIAFLLVNFFDMFPRETLIQIGHSTHSTRTHTQREEQIHRETLHHHFFLNCHLSFTFQKKRAIFFYNTTTSTHVLLFFVSIRCALLLYLLMFKLLFYLAIAEKGISAVVCLTDFLKQMGVGTERI